MTTTWGGGAEIEHRRAVARDALPILEKVGKHYWIGLFLGVACRLWPVALICGALLVRDLYRLAVVPISPQASRSSTIAAVMVVVSVGALLGYTMPTATQDLGRPDSISLAAEMWLGWIAVAASAVGLASYTSAMFDLEAIVERSGYRSWSWYRVSLWTWTMSVLVLPLVAWWYPPVQLPAGDPQLTTGVLWAAHDAYIDEPLGIAISVQFVLGIWMLYRLCLAHDATKRVLTSVPQIPATDWPPVIVGTPPPPSARPEVPATPPPHR